jgi:hypothetical protein
VFAVVLALPVTAPVGLSVDCGSVISKHSHDVAVLDTACDDPGNSRAVLAGVLGGGIMVVGLVVSFVMPPDERGDGARSE